VQVTFLQNFLDELRRRVPLSCPLRADHLISLEIRPTRGARPVTQANSFTMIGNEKFPSAGRRMLR